MTPSRRPSAVVTRLLVWISWSRVPPARCTVSLPAVSAGQAAGRGVEPQGLGPRRGRGGRVSAEIVAVAEEGPRAAAPVAARDTGIQDRARLRARQNGLVRRQS